MCRTGENQDQGQCRDPCYVVNWQEREISVALANVSLLFFTTPAFTPQPGWLGVGSGLRAIAQHLGGGRGVVRELVGADAQHAAVEVSPRQRSHSDTPASPVHSCTYLFFLFPPLFI